MVEDKMSRVRVGGEDQGTGRGEDGSIIFPTPRTFWF